MNKLQPIREEEEDFYSDDDLFKISSWGADLSFRELVQRYKDKEIIKPELQRKYVWDKTEASRFIDSLLLGLPVPSLFLAKLTDENMLIVDGYQRIMTVHDFIEGIWGGDRKVFKLVNSEKINKRWRGKAFTELSDTEQKRIKNTTIHSIIFVQQHPNNDDTSLYQVFERINTSGRTLMPQEIRNCVYQGSLNNLLFELNRNKKWRILFGHSEEDNRMKDIELILRFFALMSKDFAKMKDGNISLKKFLNQFMGSNKKASEKILNDFKQKFEKTIDFIHDSIGENAFNNLSSTPGKFSPNFSPTIFDSISIATCELLEAGFVFKLKKVHENRIKLLEDEDYRSVITQETMRKDSILTRIQKVKSILYKA